MKLLTVDGLTASRDGHVLLERIRCEIRAGQVTGIISDNPDRLNFLLNVLGGIEPELSGRLLYEGRPWSLRERLKGVGIAREQVSLVESLSVLDNLFLSNTRLLTRFGIIQRAARRRHARTVLRRLETSVALDQPLQAVEPNTRTILDLARVLVQAPEIYAFNGTTRTMSLRQYEAFQALVKELTTLGKGVIVIPLNAGDVRALVDRLYFLQGSQLFEIDQCQDLSDEQLHDFFLGNVKKHYKTANDPIQRAKQLIDAQAAAPEIDFPKLAEEVAMSYDNFRRRFKSQLGVSPNQYFLSVKIDRAKELLLFTDTEIKDVAQQVGFSDPYYFSRVFKEKAGISPARFRSGQAEEKDG